VLASGASVEEVDVSHSAAANGSRYSPIRLVRLALHVIAGFWPQPVQWIGVTLGVVCTLAAAGLGIYGIVYWIDNGIGGGINNHLAWHKLLMGLLGLFYNRPEMMDYCLNGRRGLVPLLADGLLDDGLWCESSLTYQFAAIVPICGVGNPNAAAPIKDMPAWVFHGAKDDVVPLSGSKDMVEALQKLGSSVRFTIYPDAGHDSWTQAYNSPELYTWLLAQRRPSAPTTATAPTAPTEPATVPAGASAHP
jgi:pimeloyl-ACP methyl ester carboxylesterase